MLAVLANRVYGRLFTAQIIALIGTGRWFHEPDVERARLREVVAQALGERH